MRPAAAPGVGPGLLARPPLGPSVSVRGARDPNAGIGGGDRRQGRSPSVEVS